MKNITLSLFALCTILSADYSQVHEDWVQRFNGPGNGVDVANDIAVDASGNVYVTGESYAEGTGKNYATIKYNSSGAQQWLSIYNGPANTDDAALSIAVDGEGNVYVTGYSFGSGSFEDYATIKYNSSGTQVWVKRYNGPGNSEDQATKVAVDPFGSVYVTGFSTGSGTGFDYATVKYNSSGTQQWVQRYTGSSNSYDQAYSLALDGSQNVIVTGMCSVSSNDKDFITIKYNSSGVPQWERRFAGSADGWDVASKLCTDVSGNVYVTGYSADTSTFHDILTIKYNSSGTQQWVKRYNGSENRQDEGNAIAVDGAGNVFVAGFESALVPGGGYAYDLNIIKYNSAGTQQWVQKFNGTSNGYDEASAISVDASGNAYVAGYSYGGGPNCDFITIKYNATGVQQWFQRYSGPANGIDKVYAMCLDAQGNVYVTGPSDGSGTSSDYATVKYSQQIGIRKISSQIPDEFYISQNYPNPFNPTTKIKFDVPVSPLNEMEHPALREGAGGFTSLVVYDILGREVTTLVNRYLHPGTYEVEWDGTDYPSGIYFYRLTAQNFSKSKIMVLSK